MVLYPADLAEATVSIVCTFTDGSVCLQTKAGKTLVPGGTLRISSQLADADRKNSGIFYMTNEGVSQELPDESISYLKAVTLGDAALSAETLTTIAGKLSAGAVLDFGDADYATTEFPNVFMNRTNLREIVMPRNIETFAAASNFTGAFYRCTNLQRAVFPEGVKLVPQNCFRECSSLEAVEIPASVAELGEMAFYNCKKLVSIAIPDGISVLPRSLFEYCSSLASVKIPDSLTELKSDVFNGCTAMAEIVLPESITTMDSSIFEGCTSLKAHVFRTGLSLCPKGCSEIARHLSMSICRAVWKASAKRHSITAECWRMSRSRRRCNPSANVRSAVAMPSHALSSIFRRLPTTRSGAVPMSRR